VPTKRSFDADHDYTYADCTELGSGYKNIQDEFPGYINSTHRLQHDHQSSSTHMENYESIRTEDIGESKMYSQLRDLPSGKRFPNNHN